VADSPRRIGLRILLLATALAIGGVVAGHRSRAPLATLPDVRGPLVLEQPAAGSGPPAPGIGAPREPEAPAERVEITAPELAAPALAPPATLYGRLTDRSGEVIPVGHVQLWSALGLQHPAEVRSGDYRHDRLAPGRWWVRVAGEGYRRAWCTVDLAAGEERRLDLVVERCLAVNVLLERALGRETELALQPLVTLDPPGERHVVPRGAHPHGRGRFDRNLTGDRLGTLYLEDELPLYVSLVWRGQVLASQELVEPVPSLRFALDPERVSSAPARLRLRVLDREGRPARTSGALLTGRILSTLVLDDDGRAEIEGLSAGRSTVAFLDLGISREVDLRPGTDLELVLRQGEQATLRGRLVDAAGRPLEDPPRRVALTVRGAALGSGAPAERQWVLDVQAQGAFSAELDPGSVDLWVEDVAARSARRRLDVEAGATLELDFALQPYQALVLQPPASGWEDRRCTVVDERGDELALVAFAGPYPHRVRVVPGRYRVQGLDPRDAVCWERVVEVGDVPSVLRVP